MRLSLKRECSVCRASKTDYEGFWGAAPRGQAHAVWPPHGFIVIPVEIHHRATALRTSLSGLPVVLANYKSFDGKDALMSQTYL